MKLAHFSIQGSLHSKKLTVQILKEALHRVFHIAVRDSGRGDFPFFPSRGRQNQKFYCGEIFLPSEESLRRSDFDDSNLFQS